MFRPAKISAFCTLLGAVSAWAAPLDPALRHAVFQPRPGSPVAGAKVLKPGEKKVAVGRWSGVTVQRITPVAAADIKVELDGAAVARPAATALRQAPVTPAGGAR